MRLRTMCLATIAASSALLLGGCAYDSFGDDYDYAGPGAYGYAAGYAGNGYYASPYGYGYGWYDDFYYPGGGFYIYDRAGRRHPMRDRDRDHWWRGRGGGGDGIASGGDRRDWRNGDRDRNAWRGRPDGNPNNPGRNGWRDRRGVDRPDGAAVPSNGDNRGRWRGSGGDRGNPGAVPSGEGRRVREGAQPRIQSRPASDAMRSGVSDGGGRQRPASLPGGGRRQRSSE